MTTDESLLDRREFVAGATATAVAGSSLLGACASPSTATATATPTPTPTPTPTVSAAAPMPDYFDSNFGVSPEAIRKVMAAALQTGGDFADLFFQHQNRLGLGLEDDVVNRATSGVSLGVGIRVVVGDQTGYAYTESLTLDSMVAAAKTAAGVAKSASRAPAQNLTAIKHPSYYDGADWAQVQAARVVPMLDAINAKTRAADTRVERARVNLNASHSVVMVVDSEGRVSHDIQPMTVVRLSLVMNRWWRTPINGWNMAGREGLEFYSPSRIDTLTRTAVDRTAILFEAQKPPAGEMPVVLAAGSSGILLHEAIGHGMEADFNRKGTSIFADRIGKKVAADFVSIVDSGMHPKQRGAINFDDEGNTSQATYLVQNGVLRSYLHDRISAKHYGVEPTGSGRRQSFRHMPMPRMRSTYMLDGPHERDEIFKSVKRGIYAISFTNGQVKIGAGDYSFYVKNGFLIEDGKLTAPIKDVNIIGNGPESLERITMVGNDFEMDQGGWTCGKNGQSVPVSLGLPTVLVSNIVVGGAA